MFGLKKIKTLQGFEQIQKFQELKENYDNCRFWKIPLH